jgi:hypothetical protein
VRRYYFRRYFFDPATQQAFEKVRQPATGNQSWVTCPCPCPVLGFRKMGHQDALCYRLPAISSSAHPPSARRSTAPVSR